MAMEGHCRKKLFLGLVCSVSLLATALLPEADSWPASINILLQLCVQNMPVNSQLVPTSLEPPAVDSVVLRHHPSDEQASDFPVHPPASLHPAAPWKTVFSRHGHKCPKPSPLSLQVGSWPGLFRVSLAASAISTPEGCFLLAYRLRIKPGLGSKHT